MAEKTEIPYHINYAIQHEEKCIAHRKAQIKNYEKKIKLLKKGTRMSDVLNLCPSVSKGPYYSQSFYGKLKKDWNRKNGIKTNN